MAVVAVVVAVRILLFLVVVAVVVVADRILPCLVDRILPFLAVVVAAAVVVVVVVARTVKRHWLVDQKGKYHQYHQKQNAAGNLVLILVPFLDLALVLVSSVRACYFLHICSPIFVSILPLFLGIFPAIVAHRVTSWGCVVGKTGTPFEHIVRVSRRIDWWFPLRKRRRKRKRGLARTLADSY